MKDTTKNVLLVEQDEQAKVDIHPREAAKVVRRVRKVHFFIRVNAELVTERDEEAGTYKYFPDGSNIEVSQRQALKFLADLTDTADRLAKREKNPCENATISVTRLGRCLFIG